MEQRKITIANTSDQTKKVVMTNATTLGELKAALDEANINYQGLDFIEALTKTHMRSDDSVLPHDVPWNHTTTNELVFLLTVPNHKIKSGTRNDVYDMIENCDDSELLQAAIYNHFNRAYTMVTTPDLEDFVHDWNNLHNNGDESQHLTVDERVSVLEKKVANLYEGMMETIDVLRDECIDTSEIESAIAKNVAPEDKTVYSAGMSAAQIDDLVNSVD